MSTSTMHNAFAITFFTIAICGWGLAIFGSKVGVLHAVPVGSIVSFVALVLGVVNAVQGGMIDPAWFLPSDEAAGRG